MNISFSLTTPQIRDQTKTVTRRLGWSNLKPGQRLVAIEKGQGLKKGEKVKRITIIEVVSNAPEPLNNIILIGISGFAECRLEGFPKLEPLQFVVMFCQHNKCNEFQTVNRIEFRYLLKPGQPVETKHLSRLHYSCPL